MESAIAEYSDQQSRKKIEDQDEPMVLKISVLRANDVDIAHPKRRNSYQHHTLLVSKPMMWSIPWTPVLQTRFVAWLNSRGIFHKLMIFHFILGRILNLLDTVFEKEVEIPSKTSALRLGKTPAIPDPVVRVIIFLNGFFMSFLLAHATSKPILRRVLFTFDNIMVSCGGMTVVVLVLVSNITLAKEAGVYSFFHGFAYGVYCFGYSIPVYFILGTFDAVACPRFLRLLFIFAMILVNLTFYVKNRFARSWVKAEICVWSICIDPYSIALACRIQVIVFSVKHLWALLKEAEFAVLHLPCGIAGISHRSILSQCLSMIGKYMESKRSMKTEENLNGPALSQVVQTETSITACWFGTPYTSETQTQPAYGSEAQLLDLPSMYGSESPKIDLPSMETVERVDQRRFQESIHDIVEDVSPVGRESFSL